MQESVSCQPAGRLVKQLATPLTMLKHHGNETYTQRNDDRQNEGDAVNNKQNAFSSPGRAKKRTVTKFRGMRT